MKTFKIRALATSVCYLEVEAEDEDAAYRLGKDADGGVFAEEESEGSWEVTGVEDLTPPDPLNDIIAKLWIIEEQINEQCTDVQDQEEEKGNFSSGFGDICVPEDASPELDHARTLVQEAIGEIQEWRKQVARHE
jgi:hypothetical protein